ncbi:MAG: AAA family ATPase [Candidatus Methanomethylophilaceae archaeon]|nr:AAA family ATPase [Candidatus Methanomethylophilaceae archaeon]
MPERRILGRESELSYLEGLWERDGLVTCCLWGRRRVGKTSILREFGKDKRTLSLQGIEGSYYENLSSLTLDVSEFLGKEVPQVQDLTHLMKIIEDICRADRTLVVFDELPYLLESAPQASSVIQKSLDGGLRDLDCMFVVCGSSISVMRRETEDARKPLFGRFEHRKQIKPLSIEACREFHPDLDPETSLRWYCTVGGIPYYHLDTSGKSYRQLVEERFLDRDGSWRGDATSLILHEFNGNRNYTGAVRCIADGTVKQSEIADKLRMDRAACKRLLDDLESVGIVERRVPMGDSPKKPVYSIKDPFVAFSFTVIYGHVRLIGGDSPRSVVYDLILEDIETQLGHMFEMFCGEWMDSKYPVVERGQWWGRVGDADADIDIVAKVADDRRFIHTVLGECKFRGKPMGFAGYNTLASRAKAARFTENVTYALFSATGFEDDLSEYADENGIKLIDGRTLVGDREPPELFRDRVPEQSTADGSSPTHRVREPRSDIWSDVSSTLFEVLI